MKLSGVELVRVDIPFRDDVGTGAGVHSLRPLLFVRVVAEDGEGWGECAALAGGTAVDPPLDEVEQAAVERGVPRLVRGQPAAGRPAAPAAPRCRSCSGARRPTACWRPPSRWRCADAELRAEGRSLADALGIGEGFEAMAVGAVVGIPPGHDLACAAGRGGRRGARRRGPRAAQDRARLGASSPCAPCGPTIPTSCSRSTPTGPSGPALRTSHVLSRLADFDVLCIEQPLPPADLVAHAQLARVLPVPICLDESLSTPRRVRDALRNGAVRHGLPEAGPARGRARRPDGARGVRGRRASQPSSAASSRPARAAPPTWPWRPGSARTRRAWSATSATRPTTSRSTRVATRPWSAAGSGCPDAAGSREPPR